MGKFEGPFGVPTPERVFEDYNERCRNNTDNSIDDLYGYCDHLENGINELYDFSNEINDDCEKLKKKNKSLKKRVSILENRLDTIEKQFQKLTESMERPHLINPIIRI